MGMCSSNSPYEAHKLAGKIDWREKFMSKLASEIKVDRPLGFCVEIGPRSVIGRKELNRIVTALGILNIRPKSSFKRL